MPQSTSTVLLRGGLNIVTPPVAVPPGQCTAALNYEPEVAGYKRIGGYERFDGQTAPSAGGTRGDITTVPGTGPVRGVWVYDGSVWAFRDTVSGEGAMYKATSTGWVQQSFNSYVVTFTAGTAAFLEGEVLTGGTSSATATIKRVVIRTGSFAGSDATGYLVVSDISGTFAAELGTSASGSATINGSSEVALISGGRYEFANHNFYGAVKRPRMYFCNGVGTAFEWDGEVLCPIQTGNDAGPLDEVIELFHRGNDNIVARNGDRIVMRGEHDKPTHIGQYQNHLFLAFRVGSIIHSGVGEPLDYRSTVGAGEIAFGSEITGLLPSASTALVIFGASRVEYLTGSSENDFLKQAISDGSGAFEWTAQVAGEQPVYLDEAGLRKLGTTSAFGDWRMGTLTQASEPLFRKKKDNAVSAVASLRMRSKDQYWLFFDDNSGVILYLGRKEPELLPILFPFEVSSACSGELDPADGERHFVGGDDGYVYELDKGTSFDGAEVQAYIRLPWNTIGAPSQQKRFHKASFDIDAPEACTIGIAFHVDYAAGENPGGARQNISVAQGSQSLIDIADYDTIDWSQAVQGSLEAYLDGIGRNCAVTLVSEHTDEEPHTLSSMTINFTPRRVLR